jgi:hypothetical protein
MFQPLTMIGARKLEHQAGFVAERAGIQLPSANFHGISARFLRDLGLSVEKLLPYACRLYEWYTPSGLFLSSRQGALPTKVYVMAMLIITLKTLYNLHSNGGVEAASGLANEIVSKSPFEPSSPMTTRAKKKRSVEDGMNEDQQMGSVRKSLGSQLSVGTARKVDASTPQSQVLGKRKRSCATSQDDVEKQGSGESMPDVGATDSKSLERNTGFREAQKELGDTNELLTKLETVKPTVSTSTLSHSLVIT